MTDTANNNTPPRLLVGILIDPETREVKAIKLDSGNLLAQLREHLGCSIVEAVTVHEYPGSPGFREALWIDEEGRLTYPHPHGYFGLRRHDGKIDLYCGRGLILADGPDGYALPTGLSVEEVSSVAVFFDELPSEEAVEPHIEILTGDEAEAAIAAMTGGVVLH